jgi:hypothetical protein
MNAFYISKLTMKLPIAFGTVYKSRFLLVKYVLTPIQGPKKYKVDVYGTQEKIFSSSEETKFDTDILSSI